MMDQALTPQQKVIDLDGVEIGTVARIFRESEQEPRRYAAKRVSASAIWKSGRV